jgi:WD40 repeat protein/tRNA A-37 threonylcarbamoyl transferase component Bud32
VWLAEDTRIARKVALKLLPAEFSVQSTERRRRLQREAEVIARLDHPCLCAVLEARMDGERPYIAMRYVQGSTLAEWIAAERSARAAQSSSASKDQRVRASLSMAPSNALEQARILSFFERAARALHAAHQAGVVHRDVKPQNIMVAQNGDPVVLDFGQARDESADSFELTRSGDVLGTPAYMSPEQILGRRAGIDLRTDVWSLGASLYEALTLERPFTGGNVPALFMAIREAPLVDPRAHNKALSVELCRVVATALEREPQRRYASALEFAEDLRRVREYEPIHARAPSAWYVFRSWVRRHPALAASTLGSIAALTIGLAASLYLLRQVNAALDFAVGRHLSQRSEDLIEQDPAAALALGIEGAQLAETFQTRAALFRALQACYLRSVIDAGKPARLIVDCDLSHDGERAAVGLDDGRVLLCSLESGLSETVAAQLPAEVRAVRFSADDAYIALVAADGTARVVSSIAGNSATAIELLDLQARAVEFLDSDRSLIALSDRGALAADARTGKRLWKFELPATGEPSGNAEFAVHAGAERALVWSLGADRGGSSRAWLLDTRTGTVVSELEAGGKFLCAEFQRDGRAFACGSSDGSLRVYRAADGELERDLDNGAPLRSLRFSADGRRLIALLDEGLSSRAWLWYLESGASIPLQGIAGLRVAHAAFSPDGDSIATVSSDMVVRLWSARDARLLRSFKGGLFQPMEIAWNADASRLVMRANDARLQVWYANERPDVFELRGSGGALNAARFSPDGERVLTACEDGQARVWTAPSRLLTAQVEDTPAPAQLLFAMRHRGSVRDARHSPDGTRIATASSDGSARLWDASDGRELAVLLDAQTELEELAWDASSTHIAVRSRDGRAWSCDPAAGRSVALASSSAITALVWIPGREQIAGALADDVLRVWSARDGALLHEGRWEISKRHRSGGLAIAARADGAELCVACADGRARIFSADARLIERREVTAFLPRSVSYSADSSRLLVCGVEGRGAVRLQDLVTHRQVFQDIFHTGDVTSGSFSPDGRWLITTAKSGGAFVRDARDGSPYAHFPGPGGACFAGSISPGAGETRALVATEGGSVWVWPLDPLAAAIARRPRPLTELERRQEQRLALPLPYDAQGER